MIREDALELLRSGADISFLEVDAALTAFGFVSASPNFETEVYYHPVFKVGKFVARDDGLHVLTPDQVKVALYLILQVVLAESTAP